VPVSAKLFFYLLVSDFKFKGWEIQATSKSTFNNPLNQNRSKCKQMKRKIQLYENRLTLAVLGHENLKQVLFSL